MNMIRAAALADFIEEKVREGNKLDMRYNMGEISCCSMSNILGWWLISNIPSLELSVLETRDLHTPRGFAMQLEPTDIPRTVAVLRGQIPLTADWLRGENT